MLLREWGIPEEWKLDAQLVFRSKAGVMIPERHISPWEIVVMFWCLSWEKTLIRAWQKGVSIYIV